MIPTGRPRRFTPPDESLESWLLQERERAVALLLRNVSPPGAMPGAIVASPSRANPDYYYQWVRDSGIAIKAIILLYQSTVEPAARRRYFGLLMDFVDFSRHTQQTAVRDGGGLGEPKFTVEGEPYLGPWGRPQNDGPAIRALELAHLAFLLLDEGQQDLVTAKLYAAPLQDGSVIKTDLEYISHHWSEPCYDVWEEVRGHHFFTQLLSLRALRKGAALAARLGDGAAAGFYLEQARPLGEALRLHWDPARRYLVSCRDRSGGLSGERSSLDSSVVVATLGGYSLEEEIPIEDVYPVNQEEVLATVVALEDTFEALYPINDRSRGIPGIAIGRYPEDRYDGYRTDSLGDPWPCLTIAFGYYYYKLTRRLQVLERIAFTPTNLPFFQALPVAGLRAAPGEELAAGDPRFDAVIQALFQVGDAYLARARYHACPDGSMAEQMNRVTGAQQGAPDLTMNYAAFLLAMDMRRRSLASP